MEFRWIVFLTVWTTLSGPMLVRPSLGGALGPHNPTAKRPAPAVSAKPDGLRRQIDTCRGLPRTYP